VSQGPLVGKKLAREHTRTAEKAGSETASRDFHTDGKVTQIDNANGASLKNYGYDNAFRITGITDAGNSALSWTYGYDALDRLNSDSKTGFAEGWTYDANGNRSSETGTNASTYANSSSSNRVSSISGALARSYSYDNAGNTLSYSGATFTYNNRGRMATASNGGVTATYVYNALGQRVKRTASGTTTIYAYDEAGHLAGEYTGGGALIQETVWLGDTPVATLRPNGSGGVTLFYVHADHLNTPRIVTDTSNNIRWSWDSDPFGTTAPNQNPSSIGNFEYNLRFPGQQYDAIVGLHYNYFRDYDPAVGRYVESDPIGLGGGIGSFSYSNANPIGSIDPLGLFSMSTIVSWSDDGGGTNGEPGLTTQQVGQIRCLCTGCGNNWTLSECSGVYDIQVFLGGNLSPLNRAISRRFEEEHVSDLREGAPRIKQAAEKAEALERTHPYSSKAACESNAVKAVIAAIIPVLNQLQMESFNKRHVNGGHNISPWLNW